jgi:hypothetical protein
MSDTHYKRLEIKDLEIYLNQLGMKVTRNKEHCMKSKRIFMI